MTLSIKYKKWTTLHIIMSIAQPQVLTKPVQICEEIRKNSTNSFETLSYVAVLVRKILECGKISFMKLKPENIFPQPAAAATPAFWILRITYVF